MANRGTRVDVSLAGNRLYYQDFDIFTLPRNLLIVYTLQPHLSGPKPKSQKTIQNICS